MSDSDEPRPVLLILALLFAPLLAVLVVISTGVAQSSSSAFGTAAFAAWLALNTVCTALAAWHMLRPRENIAARIALAALLFIVLWVVSAVMTAFGGCLCAVATVR